MFDGESFEISHVIYAGFDKFIIGVIFRKEKESICATLIDAAKSIPQA